MLFRTGYPVYEGVGENLFMPGAKLLPMDWTDESVWGVEPGPKITSHAIILVIHYYSYIYYVNTVYPEKNTTIE